MTAKLKAKRLADVPLERQRQVFEALVAVQDRRQTTIAVSYGIVGQRFRLPARLVEQIADRGLAEDWELPPLNGGH